MITCEVPAAFDDRERRNPGQESGDNWSDYRPREKSRSIASARAAAAPGGSCESASRQFGSGQATLRVRRHPSFGTVLRCFAGSKVTMRHE